MIPTPPQRLGLVPARSGADPRLAWPAKRPLLLVGAGLASLLFLAQPYGQRSAVLLVAPVLYAACCFKGRNAVAHLVVVAALGAAALALTLPGPGAAEAWVLGVGALAQASAAAIVLRRSRLESAAPTGRTSATLDAFFQHSSTGFAFLDRELRHVRVNEPFAHMLGRPAEEIVGMTVGELAPHLADALEPLLVQVLETRMPVRNLEVTSADGARHYLVSYYAIVEHDGTVGIGETVADVTDLKDIERRLEETNERLTVLATTDELTALPNRRMLAEALDLALARARRGGLAVAVLCLDLDRFKEINDSLGHAVGDDLLVEVASRLRAGARETDVVARYGGDEFVILLADLDVQAAPELAATVVERLRSLLAEPFAIGPVELQVEASVGIAMYPLDSRDAKGLLAAADAEMYAGKSAVSRVA